MKNSDELNSNRIRKISFFYYLLMTILFCVVSIYSANKLTETYIPGINYISQLGGISANPLGHRIWNYGMILIGIGLFLLIYLQWKHISIDSAILKWGWLLLGWQACAGFIFIGLFPEDYGNVHIISAYMTLLGFLVYYHGLFFLISTTKKKVVLIGVFFLIDIVTLTLLIQKLFAIDFTFFGSHLFWKVLNTVPPYEWSIFCGIWLLKGYFSTLPFE